jgi:NadR type nicotinamide-nucleotide adenylyltransferase
MEKMVQQSPSDLHRIVLYGPESTGKTSLAKALAAHFQTEWVPEFARDFLQAKWDREKLPCSLEDLPHIVAGQMQSENECLTKAQHWLFCDTNALVTQVWSETHFNGYCAPEILLAANTYHYDFYLLMQPDLPWVKDDLRDRPQAREEMYRSFEQQLIRRNLPYATIKGRDQKRLQNTLEALKNWKNALR